jgi:hypothetical protein
MPILVTTVLAAIHTLEHLVEMARKSLDRVIGH